MEELFARPGAPLLRDPLDERVGGLPEAEEIALVGVPWDWGITGRPGAREAPARIRAALYSMRPFAPDWGRLERKPIDLGDVRIAPGDWGVTGRRVRTALQNSYESRKLTIILGGDHSISEWTMSPLLEGGTLGLLLLDAHYDMRSTSEGHTSGSWLWNLYTRYKERLRASIVGVAPYANPSYLHERALQAEFQVVSSIKAMRDPDSWREAVRLLEREGLDNYYISIDVDHLDQAYAPGVNAPSPLGLTPTVSLEIVEEAVTRLCPKGLDIVEVVPAHDIEGSTVRVSAVIVLRALQVYAEECL